MLARNAESLYWIGRYVERADDTARILDVTVHQLLEDATVDSDRTSRVLLKVLGIEHPEQGPLDVWSLTELVAYGRGVPGGSIVDSLASARENARGAREVTSSEMWECLNTTYNGLAERERAARKLGPHEFFSYVENRAAQFAGLADSTLSRDDGYRFLLLGRSIERVDMTVRLLLSRAGDRASSPTWVTVLRSAGAHDTYLRTYRGALDANRVVEFMLLDRLFPRSIFHSIRQAEICLDELDQQPNSRVGARAEAQRLLGRARSELEFMRPGVLLEDLQARLIGLQDTCRELGEAIALQYFHAAPWVAWTDAGKGNSDDTAEGEL
ncbi:MAG: alpha-E domain-containing protein [Mycobacteriaceae bacterium]